MKVRLIIIAFAAISFVACNNSQKTKSSEAGQDSAKQDAAVIAPEAGDRIMYQCPMDPEEISDKPGKCSKCGMDLEKVTIRGNDTIKGE
jgi:hypothetical protein